MLWLTVSQPVYLGVYLGIKHPSGAYDQIFITVRQLRVCWCGALSLTRGRVCSLQLLLALASAVILGSESRGTRDHILLSQIRHFLFLSPPTTCRATVDVFDPASKRDTPFHLNLSVFNWIEFTNELSFITSGESNSGHNTEQFMFWSTVSRSGNSWAVA
jgi:hypothetical protein